MGAADIVPGVSGGTVALVLGIYERLIRNVHGGAHVLKELLRGRFSEVVPSLRKVEWVWLVSLLVGILAAVAALSSVLERLLEEEPVRMAALFFGLVAGSIVVAWRLVRRKTATEFVVMLIVAAALFLVLGLRSDTESDAAEIVTRSPWVFFGAGSIAICAMILPGISGSFILVMLGMYTEVLGAVNDRDFASLGAFVAGCVVGLALFSTALNWALEHHHDLVMSAMIGLMLGSLRVLWPWPGGTATTDLAAPSGDVVVPVVLALVGAAVVIGVELVATRLNTDHA
jgi:putative membrane protein